MKKKPFSSRRYEEAVRFELEKRAKLGFSAASSDLEGAESAIAALEEQLAELALRVTALEEAAP